MAKPDFFNTIDPLRTLDALPLQSIADGGYDHRRDEFLKIFGVILAVDALIIIGMPLALILMRCSRAGLALAVAITAGVIFDYNWNFPQFNAASLGIVGLVGLPAQVMPLSLALMLVSLSMCGWAVTRDS